MQYLKSRPCRVTMVHLYITCEYKNLDTLHIYIYLMYLNVLWPVQTPIKLKR